MDKDNVKQEVEPILVDLAKNDPKPTVRANAMGLLTYYDKPEYKDLFLKHVYDSSYSIAGSALAGMQKWDPQAAYDFAKKMIKEPARGDLMGVLAAIMIKNHDAASFDVVNDYFGRPGTGTIQI